MNLMRKLVIFLVFTLLFAMPAYSAVKISPERFEFTAESGQKYINGFFTINVTGDEAIRYRVYTDFFDISENGNLVCNKDQNAKNSIVENIRFNPKEVTVFPGKPQRIRFTIINLENMPEGESRGVIFLEDAKTKVQTLYSEEKNVAANINLKTRIGIPIYLDKGKVDKTAKIKDFTVKQQDEDYVYEFTLDSTGNSKVRITGNIQVIKDKELIEEFPVTSKPVQAGTMGKFIEVIPTNKLESGQEYTVKLNLEYKDQRQKSKHLIEKTDFIYKEIPKI